MKKLIVLFASFSVFTVSAQPNYILKESSVSAIPNKATIEPMPNAIAVKRFDGIKIGNNGQGFDLYKSGPDNMIVAKPDSSFYEYMPNAIHSLNGSTVPSIISQKLIELLRNEHQLENDKTEKPFKLIKPEENKLLLNQQPHNLIPSAPSLPK